MRPWCLLELLIYILMTMISHADGRNIMYLTGQHPVPPSKGLTKPVTHVILAFLPSSIFNSVEAPTSWPLFTSVAEVRPHFEKGTKVMVAIGGWGDTEGFEHAALSEERRNGFAKNVARMVRDTGADGVDIDWEYPGGNGEDYKKNLNSGKAWQVKAYPLLLASIRIALGPHTLMSAAVPGLPRDMLAFTADSMPQILPSLDFLNIMTYDLMNRRDNVTKHHTGVKLSLDSLDAYIATGVPARMMNLGFAFYVKWFRTSADEKSKCAEHPVGCPTALMEDPITGADLGQAGAFSWHDQVPTELANSFRKATERGIYDEIEGGHYFWDEDENIWWSWDTEEAIARKFPAIVEKRGVGGVFAWGLGEDGHEFEHLKALNEGYGRFWSAWKHAGQGSNRQEL